MGINGYHVDILRGESRTPEFFKMDPSGQIPVLDIDENNYLSESNAILNYLAEGTVYLPDAGLPGSRVLQWQFYEQYSHEPNIAVACFINKYLGLPIDRREEYVSKQAGGHKALLVMEKQLS